MKIIDKICSYLILGYTQGDKQELSEREKKRERTHDLLMGKSIILTGKDSIRFHERMKYNEAHPASQEEKDRIRQTYEKIMAKSKL